MRATLLTALILTGLAAGFAAVAPPAPMIATIFERGVEARLKAPLSGTDLFDGKVPQVVLCGTGSPMPDPTRVKACTAVIATGRAYLVDAGPGGV